MTEMEAKYALVVTATYIDPETEIEEVVSLRGQFRVYGEFEECYCSVHVINTATNPLTQTNGNHYVKIVLEGGAKNIKCKINKYMAIPCLSKSYSSYIVKVRHHHVIQV